MSPYTVPYIPNLRGIAPAVPEIQPSETSQIFFIFFFFFAPNYKVARKLCFCAPNYKVARKLCFCAPISMKFGTQVALSKIYSSTIFGTICSKIVENMSDSQ